MQELNVSICDTKIGECTSNGTRRIYLRFQEDLSEELAEHMKRQIEERKTSSPDMHMMPSRVTSSLQPIGSDIEALELGILIIKINTYLALCSWHTC